ncbi:MAG: restriction endonuclease subunit S [Bacillota bacterium]
MNLNQSNWKIFDYDRIFIIKKGFYNKKPEVSSCGEIPFLGAVDNNNGITEYYSLEDIENASKTGSMPNALIEKKLFQGSAVCVTNNGSVGYAYYQNRSFTCSHDVNPLYRLDGEFNEFTGVFIASVIMHDRYRWGYGRKWRPSRMSKSKIKLPVLQDEKGYIIDNTLKYSDEGYIPDWHWMENYIKTLNYKPLTTQNIRENIMPIDTQGWKPFYLHNLMNCTMGNGIDAMSTTCDEPQYNYVSRNSNGNGVVAYVDAIEGQLPFPKGAMSLALGGSFLGSCFIQNAEFYTAQNVAVLQEKFPMSDLMKLFLATLIRNECKIKYQAFGRELNAHYKKDFILKLPIKSDSNGFIIDNTNEFSDEGYIPDWEWIERYMRSLPYSDKI